MFIVVYLKIIIIVIVKLAIFLHQAEIASELCKNKNNDLVTHKEFSSTKCKCSATIIPDVWRNFINS